MMKKLTIRQSIILIASFALIGLVLILTINANSASNTTDNLSQVSKTAYPVLELASSNNIQLTHLSEGIATAVTIGEEDALESATRIVQQMEAAYKKQMQLLPTQQAKINQLLKDTQDYYQASFSLALGMINGDIDFATVPAKAEKTSEQLKKLQGELQVFKDSAEKNFHEQLNHVEQSNSQALMTNIITGVITFVLIAVFSYLISNKVRDSLNKVTLSLKDIAQGDGDLSVRIQHDSEDELKQLVHWFNVFVEKLQKNIEYTISSINSLEQVTYQLAQSSTETHSQVNSQNIALQQTTESLQELFSSVNLITENASQASQSANDADNQAQLGNKVVSDTSQMIGELAQEIQKTADVVTQLDNHTQNANDILLTIQSIAEQTNLLALNAAIEAARAGEQGRGFAVVADEVRTLASRTQQSTIEIQQVLDELQTTSGAAVKAMNNGKAKAEQSVEQSILAGNALSEITEKVNSISSVNNSIATETQQQHQTSQQIQSYVSELETMAAEAQQNTEILDQASTEVKDISHQLAKITQEFKV